MWRGANFQMTEVPSLRPLSYKYYSTGTGERRNCNLAQDLNPLMLEL